MRLNGNFGLQPMDDDTSSSTVATNNSLSSFACFLILICNLLLFTCISIYVIYKKKKTISKEVLSLDKFYHDDEYVVFRNSQSWWSFGLSIYASGMGSWLLFATPETGMTADWLGVIGYGVSNGAPFVLMIILGPLVKEALGGQRGYTVADFVRERYGRRVQLIVALASLFFMFIFLCAELTSIGAVFSNFSTQFPMIFGISSVVIVTLICSVIGGAPATIITDRLEGLLLIGLSLASIIAISVYVVPNLDHGAFLEASQPSWMGARALGVLLISVTINQFLDQSMWQKVFACKSTKDMRLGLAFGAALSIPTVILFGAVGILAKAAKISHIVSIPLGSESASFFILLRRMPTAWLGVSLSLGIGLVSSTANSIQTGLVALMAGDVLVNKRSLHWARAGCILINVAALLVASIQFSVLSLFLTSNIISCAVVPSLGLAFWDIVTPTAAIVGIFFGLFTIPITGWIYTKRFIGGLEWFLLPYGPYAPATLITFILVFIITIAITMGAAKVHCLLNTNAQIEQRERLREMKMADASSIINTKSNVCCGDVRQNNTETSIGLA